MELLLPYATLEPVRELLLQQFMGEKFGRDSIWENHLADELWNTDVDIEVLLDEQTMRLSDILALKRGSTILLGSGSRVGVTLRCGPVGLFRGQVGRRKDRVAVKINARLPDESGTDEPHRTGN